MMIFLTRRIPSEPLPEDSACGEDQAGEHAVEDRGVPPVRGAAEEQEAAWQGRREVSATSECYDFFYLVTVHYFNGRLAEAQGIKKFDPRMSFQPKTDKENSMVIIKVPPN